MPRGRGQLIAVAGPSGVGKSTVVRRVVELRPEVWLSVSATTRGPRPGEQNGIDYLFLKTEAFDQLQTSNGLLESAEYGGNRYGTPREPVEAHLVAGDDVLLEIDVQGVRQVQEALSGASAVFIAPPSWEALKNRLVARGTEDEDSLLRRLAVAEREMSAQPEFDSVLINADVDETATRLLRWIDQLHEIHR